MLQGIRLWSLLPVCTWACHLVFDDAVGETGHSFLARCAFSALAAAEAATGKLIPESAEQRGCVDSAERLSEEALGTSPRCEQCPEGCVVVLLLQALALPDFAEVRLCSYSLMYYFRANAYFKEFEPHWTWDLRENLPALLNARRGQCAQARSRELQADRLPLLKEDSKEGQVAVLLAATASMLERYQPFINLWRCYALSHGLAFILETDPGGAPAPNWMRWFAAERLLPFYRAVLIVDPDQVIVPACWNISIPDLLGAWPDGVEPPPDVGMRDFGRPQTLNNGVALLRNSARGRFFLSLLLDKAKWFQTIEHDQGPFDETVLEVLGLEAEAEDGQGYDSECAQYLFPNVQGNHEVALYAMCWWRQSEALAGPFGQRGSRVIRFMDPRQVDVNHVVGARGLSDPALLYHFAGRSKDWDAMLDTFGLDRDSTKDCREVLNYVQRRSGECVPGGPVVEECEPPEVVC